MNDIGLLLLLILKTVNQDKLIALPRQRQRQRRRANDQQQMTAATTIQMTTYNIDDGQH